MPTCLTRSVRTTLVAAMIAFAAAAVRATVLVPADLAELAHDAQAIARGRVVAVDPQWTAGRRGIETTVTLDTERYLKGGLGETVRFRVPGGTIGRFNNVIVGAPRFEVGQRVIVFLGARGPTVPFVLGLSQGVFRLVAQENGATAVLPPPILPGVSGPVVRGSAARSPSTLAAFEAEVRIMVEGR